MLQRILTVGRAIFQLTQRFDNFRMNVANPDFIHCRFAGFTDRMIHFLLRFLIELFDTSGMNTPINDELLQGDTRFFTTYRIKARQDNSLRRIIDNQVHTGHLFKGTNIAPFSSDDASLHFVIRQRNHRDCAFCHKI